MDDDGGGQVEPGHVVVLALTAVREGGTLVARKLDRLARFVPDALAIADRLRELGVKLALGRTLYDPGDPMGKLFFNILATFAEFEADLIRMRTRQGIAIARAKGELHGKQPAAVRRTAAGTLTHACHGRVFHQRSRRALLSLKTNRLPHTQPAPFLLAYDPAPCRNRPEIRHFSSPIPDSFSLGVSGITMPFLPRSIRRRCRRFRQ